jgi:hypothetical protein
VSFCLSSYVSGATNIPITFIFTGTNYNSYTFSPSNIVLFNLINLTNVATPSITLQMVNQQKTFVDLNLTLNIDGIVFYELYIGTSANQVLSSK